MTPLIAQIVGPDGKPAPYSPLTKGGEKLFPNEDKHRSNASLHRSLATNIYRTKDGRYYHVHGNPHSQHPKSFIFTLSEQ